MLTEADRAKLVAAIKELKKQKEVVSAELAEMRAFHLAAWNQYGVELYDPEMIGKEQDKSKEIGSLHHKIRLLNAALNRTEHPRERIAVCREKLQQLKDMMHTLTVKKEFAEKDLNDALFIESFLK